VIEKVFSLKKLPAILGTAEFVQTIKDRFFTSKLSTEIPESKQLAPVTMETIKEAVCQTYGITEDALAASARGVTNTPRDITIYLARTLRGDSLKHLGEYFEIEKYSTVASAIARAKTRIKNDQGLAERVEKVVKEIDKSQKKT